MDQDRWQTLEPLLDEVMELPPEARAAWLDRLRAGSPGLAAELEVLLAREAAADREGFLEGQVDVSLAGQRLGGWTLERPLGRGGMGSVWLARRTDGRYEGQAAVKLLNLALVTPEGIQRFRREGSTLGLLTHPSIARLLDAGVSPAGQPYLVLEYVDGVPLDAWARDRDLSLRDRVALFRQVLAAVGHAHAHLIVHRDLKPSNILVSADGSVKLLDFGIAKLLDDRGEADGTHTSTQALTPLFAAPEQLAGEPVTTATDIYALGVLLYLLVSGRHPTAAGANTPAETVRSLLETEPAGLGLGDLDTILAKALRKAPAERYQTVAILSDDLQRYLDHEPVSARSPSLAYRSARFIRRHRAALLAATLIAAILIGATAFALLQRREAVAQRDAALYQTRRANAQAEFQELLLSTVGDRPITMKEMLDQGRELLEQQYGGDPKTLAAILIQMSQNYGELGDSRVRGALLVRAESLAAALGDRKLTALVHCHMADNLRTEGAYDEAWRELAAADSQLAGFARSEERAACLQIRANLSYETRRVEVTLPATREAIAIMDSLGETGDMFYISLLGNLSAGLADENRYREAVAAQLRTIALMDSTGRSGMMAQTIFRHDLALLYNELGETRTAEELLHQVLVRAARADPAGNIPTQPLIHYSELALYQGHADSAAKYFGILLDEATRDTNAYWQCRALFGLARARIRLGRLAQARAATERFRRIFRASFKRLNVDDQIADPQVLDGWLALEDGKIALANALFDSLLTRYGWSEGRDLRWLRPDALLAAATELQLGRPGAALALARKAETLAEVDSAADYRSAYVGEARLMAGRALLAMGDTAGARATLQRGFQALRTGAGPDHPLTRDTEELLARLGG